MTGFNPHREADIELIREFQGIDDDMDRRVFDHVRRALGHHALTDEALGLLAAEYQRRARYSFPQYRRVH